MISINFFFFKHKGGREFKEMIPSNCQTMKELWNIAASECVIWIATRPGVLDATTLRIFVEWCTAQVKPNLTNERNHDSLDVTDVSTLRFSNEQERSARLAEYDAINIAKRAAIRPSEKLYVRSSEERAAKVAEKTAKLCSWRAGERAAARQTNDYAAEIAKQTTSYAAQRAQASWLRANTTPNFDN